jgi:dephospho-CoA kinase
VSSASDGPWRVGLTGGIGSGKSLVADMFARGGAAIVDTDLIAHALTRPGGAAIETIRERFGAQFIDAQGALDRARMRQHVFDNDDARRALEAILHPLIRRVAEAQAQAATAAPYVVMVVPLLVESGDWASRVDRVLVVDCPVDVQIARIVGSRGLTRSQAQAIVARQASREQRLAAADDIVFNSGATPSDIAHRIARLHARYRELAAARAAHSL